MSAVTLALENEEKRKVVAGEAKRVRTDLIAALSSAETDERLADLDVGELATLVQRLVTCKFQMKNLLLDKQRIAARV